MAADFTLKDCLVPIDHDRHVNRIYGANLCIDCANACGGCAWSRVDPNTRKPRFDPVPGWTAEPSRIGDQKGFYFDTFHITACPKFTENRRETQNGT